MQRQTGAIKASDLIGFKENVPEVIAGPSAGKFLKHIPECFVSKVAVLAHDSGVVLERLCHDVGKERFSWDRNGYTAFPQG